MRYQFGRLAIYLAAAALLILAVALPPMLIGQDAPDAADPSRSWVTNAFPTAQASFARVDERRS